MAAHCFILTLRFCLSTACFLTPEGLFLSQGSGGEKNWEGQFLWLQTETNLLLSCTHHPLCSPERQLERTSLIYSVIYEHSYSFQILRAISTSWPKKGKNHSLPYTLEGGIQEGRWTYGVSGFLFS